ncbi:MAG TPA: hypothetical protein VFT61_00775 [Sphingomicrobium sp.]|nr:hypothetical protein [Sphingomicrobium sp.]
MHEVAPSWANGHLSAIDEQAIAIVGRDPHDEVIGLGGEVKRFTEVENAGALKRSFSIGDPLCSPSDGLGRSSCGQKRTGYEREYCRQSLQNSANLFCGMRERSGSRRRNTDDMAPAWKAKSNKHLPNTGTPSSDSQNFRHLRMTRNLLRTGDTRQMALASTNGKPEGDAKSEL